MSRRSFVLEDWAVQEDGFNLERLAQMESVLALSNGHIGLRANLDEGEPYGIPGTYLNGFYEARPLPYAEAGYGYPEDGQTVVNCTNGKIMRLLVDDEPFDLRYGTVLAHRRRLDLRAGTLRREVHWRSPAGREIKVRSTRIVSLVQRAIAAIDYEVEACGDGNGQTRIVLQSELVANEPVPLPSGDPRAAAALEAPLGAEYRDVHGERVILVHSTKQSRLRLAAGMDHVVEGEGVTIRRAEAREDLGRLTIGARLDPGQVLRVTKFLAYGWSSSRSLPSVRDQVDAALAAVRGTGWDDLLTTQREYLDGFWASADVEIDGDDELQRAVRFALFHILQAGARGEQRAIAAKGLTGPGYDGHAFWDTETYVLPVLTYTRPRTVADALRWRHSTLDAARARARTLGLRGAAFPWRTIGGEECSAYWPAGTAAFHVNADIADAVLRYLHASGDPGFEREIAVDLLVETARLWCSLGHHDGQGGFHIDGVTGPDEYSAIADDNVYTNLMAERNLRGAADIAALHPDVAQALGVDAEEIEEWRGAAAGMYVPFDERLGVHPQSEGFTGHEPWDFEATAADDYPLLLSHPYFELYRRQVVKQADLVLALFLRGDRFSAVEKARDFAYYESLTVRDSSLSACIQSVVAAEAGFLDLAATYFAEAAFMDLDDAARNTKDGLHLASLAGSWIAAVAGFGGMRDHDGRLGFNPRLPRTLQRLAFRMLYRGRRLQVEILPDEARYQLLAGRSLTITHGEETLELHGGAEPVARPWRLDEAGGAAPVPTQPHNRQPERHHAEGPEIR